MVDKCQGRANTPSGRRKHYGDRVRHRFVAGRRASVLGPILGRPMTLLEFLSFTAGVSGLAGALVAARGHGLLGILTGLVIGTGTGIAAFLVAYKGGVHLIDRLGLDGSNPSVFRSALSYPLVVALIILIPLAIALGDYLTRKALSVMLYQGR